MGELIRNLPDDHNENLDVLNDIYLEHGANYLLDLMGETFSTIADTYDDSAEYDTADEFNAIAAQLLEIKHNTSSNF